MNDNQLVVIKKDVEVAEDLKRRIEDAMIPVCLLMDEAVACGMQIAWDGVVISPQMRHRVNGLRVVKALA